MHGEAFGLFRGNQLAADLPGLTPPPFQREQFGANLGGAVKKDKVFYFLDAERTKQDLTAAEPFSFPFNGLDTTLVHPDREFDTDGRLDWNVRGNTRAFYRFNLFPEQRPSLRPFGSASSTQRFDNTDHTVSHTIGIDLTKGQYSHSFRFEYLRFHNYISDATAGLSSVDDPIPGLGINIGASVEGNACLAVVALIAAAQTFLHLRQRCNPTTRLNTTAAVFSGSTSSALALPTIASWAVAVPPSPPSLKLALPRLAPRPIQRRTPQITLA